jgi:putative flippase GtrA
VFATALTPIIFPSFGGHYHHGLNFPETIVLLARNLVLTGVWCSLLFEFAPGLRVPALTPRVRRFLKFCVVGGSGVIVDTAVLHLLVQGCGWNIESGKVCAAETALLSNFFWNELWTFRDLTGSDANLSGVTRRLLKFHLICGVGIAMAVVLLRLFYSWLGLNLYIANVLAILLVTLWNFFMNAAFNWSAKSSSGAPAPDSMTLLKPGTDEVNDHADDLSRGDHGRR